MNEEQIRIWNEQNAPRWLAFRAELTRAIAPYGLAALDALAPMVGERALDVGCGCGDTTLELARRVEAAGTAIGIDVCQPFIEVARAEAAGWPNVGYQCADAQTQTFVEPFDLLFSRFGVMFFADPLAAFAKLRRDLRSGGRLGVVVWGAPAANEWAGLPLEVVRRHLDVPAPGPGPGPFALADRTELVALLRAAGFSDVRAEPLNQGYVAGRSLGEAALLLLQFGPAGAALRQAGAAAERLRPTIEAELALRLAEHMGSDEVRLGAEATLATARS